MGSCFSIAEGSKQKKKPSSSVTKNSEAAKAKNGDAGSHRCVKVRSVRKDEEWIHQQAMEAAALFQRQLRNGYGTASFDRSASLRNHVGVGKINKNQSMPRCASSRTRSLTDPLLHPHQLVNEGVRIEDLETNHFILVHGGGLGAWCWYKTIALLQECGYKVTAVDLTGSGIHSFDTNTVTSLPQYVKPLTDSLEKLPPGEKVILVGHDLGGICISYAMEKYNTKISKAIFVAAAMLSNEQSALDVFSDKVGSNELMQHANVFVHSNGNEHPPTTIELDKSHLKDLLFNKSPSKDIALASVSMRPIPFAPVTEKLSLSEANYGSVRRYYIETTEDNAIPLATQEIMVNNNPPEEVFRLKGADHAPFFSKPLALHKLLVEISRNRRTKIVYSSKG